MRAYGEDVAVSAVAGPIRRALTAALSAGLLTGCAAAATPAMSGSAGVARLDAVRVGEMLHGGVLTPPDPEPRITLTDTSGRRYELLRRDTRGVTLLYFGYTHCPDICPTTMADIAEALRQSSASVRRDVTVVFVSVDPHRDSRRVIRRWLNRFDPAFVGLRGSLAQVAAAQRAAGLPVSRVEANGRAIEHSAEVLAYTPDHLGHVLYTEGPSTIDDLRHDLPILLSAAAYGCSACVNQVTVAR
jgi:protein SCO1/2